VIRVAILVGLVALPTWAEAPATSIRPQARALADVDAATPVPEEDTAARSPRPVPRPDRLTAGEPSPEQDPPAAEPAPRRGLFARLFGPPRARPAQNLRPEPAEDTVCGDSAIVGRVLEPIGSPTEGCGVAAPVQITMVDGISLSQAATVDCPTALALHRWIDDGLRPAFRGRNIVQLQIAAHYICRTRNNRPGAPISEHGRGKAIDIAGVMFANGDVAMVASDYGRAMRSAHRAACGIFGTTLGPGSDGYHEDHLHFDTADHRNGPYCR
jgi:hypothetical protein